jgi:hypothetical protein
LAELISAANLDYVSSCGNNCSASAPAANVTQINQSTGTLSSNIVTRNGLTSSYETAVDKTGNVWVTSCGSVYVASSSDPGSAVEFDDAGVPVVTPLALRTTH